MTQISRLKVRHQSTKAPKTPPKKASLNISISRTGTSDVQARLDTMFGDVSAPIWQAIADNPAAALGNTTTAFKQTVYGPAIPFTLWNTTWTDPKTLPVYDVYPDLRVKNISLGVGGLWQVVNMLDTALLPVTMSYCFTEDIGDFSEYYAVTQAQGMEFRSILGLPATCTTPDDPTCSVFFCTSQSTFVILMVCFLLCVCVYVNFVWVVGVFMLSCSTVVTSLNPKPSHTPTPHTLPRRQSSLACFFFTSSSSSQAIFTGLLFFYLVLFVWFSYRALHQLRQLSYARHRLPNVVLRLQTRESLVVMVVGILTIIALGLAGFGTTHAAMPLCVCENMMPLCVRT